MDSFGQERGVQTVERIATDLCFLDEINKRYTRGEDQNAILSFGFSSVDNLKYWTNHKNNALIGLDNYKIAISELSSK